MSRRPNILVVCGRNKRRSPTAEHLFKNDQRLCIRSAGTSESSRRRVTEADLGWADLVLAMEAKHAARLRRQFAHIQLPPMRSLDIPDDFEFMSPELVGLLGPMVEQAIEEMR